jgi:hypothetical protein
VSGVRGAIENICNIITAGADLDGERLRRQRGQVHHDAAFASEQRADPRYI